jgi:cytochrome c oxidase subunit 1
MALIGSGLLAILLVLSRTPGIQDVFPLKGFFPRRAGGPCRPLGGDLVHGVCRRDLERAGARRPGLAGLGGLRAGGAGHRVMTVSPFLPGAEPVLNNYIPVLQQPFFHASLVDLRCRLRAGRAARPAHHLAAPAFGAPLQTGAFLGAVAAFLA